MTFSALACAHQDGAATILCDVCLSRLLRESVDQAVSQAFHAAADLVEEATNDYTDEDNARDACMSLAEQLRAKATQ